MNGKELKLEVADIVISVTLDNGDRGFEVSGAYKPFLSNSQPEVRLRIHCGKVPTVQMDEPLFDSGGVWSLHRSQEKWRVCLRSPVAGPEPYQVAIFEPDFCAGDIYVRASESDHRQLPFPLGYPLGEVLMINLLCRERGVLLHACGVKDRERGLVFAGTSGAGKSTIAGLWEGREGVSVLSDDRVIVRRRGERLWVYGTPFHGSARLASPQGVPLERVFIIEHAAENRVVPLDPANVVARLFVRSFPPFWDADGMAFTLGLLGEVAQTIPCSELGFVPDGTVVNSVRCIN